LLGSSIPEGLNLIKPVLGTARRLLQNPLQNTTVKELENEVWEHSRKGENDERNYASNTDDCILIENIGPDDTFETIRRNQIIDDNPSIQKNENQSYTLQKTHEAANNQINHEENNPSIRDYEKCGTRRRDPLIYDGTETNKSIHEENNPSIRDDNVFGSSYAGDSLRTAEATTRSSTGETRKVCSEVKNTMVGDESQDEINDKEKGSGDDEDLKNTGENGHGFTRGTKELLHEIEREKRERKATEADDADVPEYLWEEHLLNDCPTPWILQERTRLRGAIRLLRARMLKWWEQRVTRSFLEWMKTEHAGLTQH
jgi:hypothetical protein